MEKLLAKLAKQLDSMDEASLMSLWDKYALIVSHFEPSKRWEEAALIFSLIQAKKWKNQLFNYHWSAQVRPNNADALHNNFTMENSADSKPKGKLASGGSQKRCKVLSFGESKGNDTL